MISYDYDSEFTAMVMIQKSIYSNLIMSEIKTDYRLIKLYKNLIIILKYFCMSFILKFILPFILNSEHTNYTYSKHCIHMGNVILYNSYNFSFARRYRITLAICQRVCIKLVSLFANNVGVHRLFFLRFSAFSAHKTYGRTLAGTAQYTDEQIPGPEI